MKLAQTLILITLVSSGVVCSAQENKGDEQSKPTRTRTLRVLFIGNSYTARHNLAQVVKQLAEAADSELKFEPTQIIYGGRTLRDHWRLGSQLFVQAAKVNADQVKGNIEALRLEIERGAEDKYAKPALKRLQDLLVTINSGKLDRSPWDWVVLQSYRDDLEGDKSLYMQFAPRFAELAREQGAQVLLYETTPTTQNAYAIAQYPDSSPVTNKAKSIGRLADQLNAKVAPMCYVGLKCQLGKPEITLRFINDAHLNKTMAYLTACTIYSAMFDRSASGLQVDSVTDIRFWNNDRKTGKDRDEKPITKVFSTEERSYLQETAWEALNEFNKLYRKN